MIDCQRYYATSNGASIQVMGYNTGATNYQAIWLAPVTMRVAPTISAQSFTANFNANASNYGAFSDNRTIVFTWAAPAAGVSYGTWAFGNFSAEL
jgi:hypothetical protein